MSIWTEERTAQLTTEYAAGEAITQIGEHVGMSRGACAGKLHRMGLMIRRKAALPGEKHARRPNRLDKLLELHFATRGRGKREGHSSAARAKRENKAQELRAQFSAVEIVDLPPDQSAVAVPFLKLNNHTCRWPLGDPRDLGALLFCGDEPHPDYPYCSRHAKLAYLPLPRRGAA